MCLTKKIKPFYLTESVLLAIFKRSINACKTS